MSIKIYVGDVSEELSIAATADDSSAFLIDRTNYKEFLINNSNDDIVAYTSLGDLTKDLDIFYNILQRADELIYLQPTQWSDNLAIDITDPTACIKGLTENLLLLISDQIPVKNIEQCFLKNNPAPVVDSRHTDQPQLWIVGCSITHGSGIDIDQRYGQLLADELDIPCSFLSKPASSIPWAASQILRADINAGDTVIWGITGSNRLSYIHDGQPVFGVTAQTYRTKPLTENIVPMLELLTENTLYNNIYAVEQVINFCDKIQVKLVLFGVLVSPNFLRYIKSKNNFVNFPYKQLNGNTVYADRGDDKLHPGPVQHQQYKDFLLNHLKK